MTPDAAPDAALRIALSVAAKWSDHPGNLTVASVVADALHVRGWLHDPDEVKRLHDMIDAAHGIICNAHQKRVDDVTNEDGASPGWAEAARRWIDAYPPTTAEGESIHPDDVYPEVTRALLNMQDRDAGTAAGGECRTRRVWRGDDGKDVRGPWEPCATCTPPGPTAEDGAAS